VNDLFALKTNLRQTFGYFEEQLYCAIDNLNRSLVIVKLDFRLDGSHGLTYNYIDISN